VTTNEAIHPSEIVVAAKLKMTYRLSDSARKVSATTSEAFHTSAVDKALQMVIMPCFNYYFESATLGR